MHLLHPALRRALSPALTLARRMLTPLLVLCLSSTAARAEDLQPVFDLSALDAFWPVVEILQQDLDPPAELWDALFDAPAYHVLVEEDMTPVYFERMLNLVYRPSLRSQRDAALADPQSQAAVGHFVETWERRSSVDRAARDLARRGVSEDLLASLRALLPAELPAGHPTVALVVWANAGRGGDPILVDPLSISYWDVPGYIAHELHHWYRDQLLDYTRSAVEEADRPLLTWLEALQAEGIADQIDKHAWIEGTVRVDPARASYLERYRHALQHVNDSVVGLDTGLSAWLAGTNAAEKRAAGLDLAEVLPLGAHPLGYFMTRTILGAFGRERLVAIVGNPFAFARLYDAAARTGGSARPLSDEAMAALDALEKKYVGTGR